MEWILYVVFMLNGIQHTAEIRPIGSFCTTVAADLHKKSIKINNEDVEVVSAFCVRSK
ncbi:MAG TPA: hypothetical protein VJ201_03460 [Candidatus Babeliales bacterium]|nr:hypothetical protein [Candidatus Babeliales bacterium]